MLKIRKTHFIIPEVKLCHHISHLHTGKEENLVILHCKKSWRSSATPASGDAGPIHTGIEQIFRHLWRKFYYKYRIFSTEFFKCRTSSVEMDCLKSNITWARTYVFRFTFQYSTTAPHFLWVSIADLHAIVIPRQLYNC